jgi:hypothetical protein
MSFAGKLAEFSLVELLQVIASSGGTGKLRLTRADADGIIVFRDGKIVYAASSSARQTLGNILLCNGHVSEEALHEALDSQVESKEELRLGTILLNMQAIDEETLKQIVQQQTEKVIAEFMGWNSGYFKLDQIELSDYGEIEVDAQDFLMREGLHTETVLSQLEARLEELKQPDNQSGTSTDESGGAPRSLATLKSIMGEIRGPEFTGEVTQKILGFTRDILGRGAIFVVRQDGFSVMGQFGIDSEDGQLEESLRELLIPALEPSILADCSQRKESVLGPIEPTLWNQSMLSAMGGPATTDSVAVPLTVNEKVLLVLYADNLSSDAGSGWLEELELLMLQAGLAMEKDLLYKRIEHYENLRRE